MTSKMKLNSFIKQIDIDALAEQGMSIKNGKYKGITIVC